MALERSIRAAMAVCLLGACGGSTSASDAGTDAFAPIDAFTATDAAGGSCPSGQVAVSGGLGVLNGMGLLAFAADFQVCAVGTSTCVMTDPLGAYRICAPASSDDVLRFTHMGSPSWLRPVRVGTTPVNAQATAMPSQAATDQLLSSLGGMSATTGYAIVYVQGPLNTADPTRLSGMTGWQVTTPTAGATVHYVSTDWTQLDATAAATNASGLVLVVLPGAATDPTAPTRLDLHVALATGQPMTMSCNADPALNFVDGTPTMTDYHLHAPVAANHITYAAFIHCPTM